MSAVPESQEPLSPDEVEAELEKLTASASDFQRAKSIAASFCGGLTGWSAQDLLQETMTKFLEGARTWPRGIHRLVVLKTAMRSVASNIRKHNDSSPIDDIVVLAGQEASDEEAERFPGVHGVVAETPESLLSGEQELAAVYAAVAGNEDLQMVVMAWADDLRGDEAAKELGWDKNKYEAARKRLTRRLYALDLDRRKT